MCWTSYAEEPEPKRPVVCFDESLTLLIGEVREPVPAAPGRPERYDCEYRRNGTANLFVFLNAHAHGTEIEADPPELRLRSSVLHSV